MRDDPVFRSLRQIAAKLHEIGVPYAVGGGMALVAHGYDRTTVDVDEVQRRRSQMDERVRRLEAREEDLEVERQRTKSQRRRIASRRIRPWSSAWRAQLARQPRA